LANFDGGSAWGDRSEVSMVPLGCPSWNPRHARAHPGLELGDAAVGMGFNGSIIIIIINGLVSGKKYRKPWFLPLNIGFSCKFSPKPIH
jgi:hypothetical protein